MIVRWLILLSLPFILALTPPIIIQPYYVYDIYRNQIVANLPSHVTVLTLHRDSFRSSQSEKYSLKAIYSRVNPTNVRPVVLLGDLGNKTPTYFNTISGKVCECFTVKNTVTISDYLPLVKATELLNSKNIYTINDESDVSHRRLILLTEKMAELDKDIVIHNSTVSSESELRAALAGLNQKPIGLMYINAFDLKSDKGGHISYRYIECTITYFNKKHLDVGIYRRNHCAALAIGADPKDIAGRVLERLTSGLKVDEYPTTLVTKTSVNLERLKELNLLRLATSGFKEVSPYEYNSDEYR